MKKYPKLKSVLAAGNRTVDSEISKENDKYIVITTENGRYCFYESDEKRTLNYKSPPSQALDMRYCDYQNQVIQQCLAFFKENPEAIKSVKKKLIGQSYDSITNKSVKPLYKYFKEENKRRGKRCMMTIEGRELNQCIRYAISIIPPAWYK